MRVLRSDDFEGVDWVAVSAVEGRGGGYGGLRAGARVPEVNGTGVCRAYKEGVVVGVEFRG